MSLTQEKYASKTIMTIMLFLIAMPMALSATASLHTATISQNSPSNGASFTDPSSITFRTTIEIESPLTCNGYNFRIYWEPADYAWIDYVSSGWYNTPIASQTFQHTWNYPPVPDTYRWWVTVGTTGEGGPCWGQTDSTASSSWTFYTLGETIPSPPHIDYTSPVGTLSEPKTSVDLTCRMHCPDPAGCDYRIEFPTGTTVKSGTTTSCSSPNCIEKTKTVSVTPGNTYSWRCRIWDSYDQIDSETETFVNPTYTCTNHLLAPNLISPPQTFTYPAGTVSADYVWRQYFTGSGYFDIYSLQYRLFTKVNGIGSYVNEFTSIPQNYYSYTDSSWTESSVNQGCGGYPLTDGMFCDWYMVVWDNCTAYPGYASTTRRYYVAEESCPEVTSTQLSPYDGEVKGWELTNTTLQWTVNVSEKTNVTTKIFLSYNGGAFYTFFTNPAEEYSPPFAGRWTLIPLTPGSTYQWYITVNNSCNSYTTPVRTFSVQSTPSVPSVSIISPADGYDFPEATESITFKWTVTSSSGYNTIDRLYVNSGLKYTSPSHPPGTYTHEWTGFVKGASYNAYATATDSIGTGTSGTISFSIDCTPDWQRTTGPCQINNKRLITYIDSNNCYGATPPADNGTYEDCVFCRTEYYCSEYEKCTGQQVQKCLNVRDKANCCSIDESYCGIEPDITTFDKQCYYGDELEINPTLVDTQDYEKGFLPELYRALINFISPWFIPFIILVVVIMFAMTMFMIYKRIQNEK